MRVFCMPRGVMDRRLAITFFWPWDNFMVLSLSSLKRVYLKTGPISLIIDYILDAGIRPSWSVIRTDDPHPGLINRACQ
ncbi:hypothetical protein [Desulfobacter curvatus]|uniref:hypothetical protein n=1 Tax=Desulfobacter curvatus TaxID=2290 RepID=UPI0003A46C77|nr:hypothetical protein [Desulfobacter curvatus]